MNLNESEESQLNFLNHELQKVIKSSSGGDNDEDYEKFINSSDFKTILSCFGGSKSEKVKTTSLIFLSKLIEKFYNDAEKNSNKTTTSSSLLLLFKQKTFEIISNWTNSTKKIDKLFGYNALLYIFKVFYELGEEVLNKAGFLEEMMDCVEFEDEQVQLTILEILSLACSQKNSRLLIAANCQEYLKSLMISKNQHLKSLSAVISTKIFLDEKSKNNNDNDPIVNTGLFRNLVLDSDSNYEVRKNAIEGLAYSNNSILYGVAVVLSNITMYRKKLNETEEQILKLKKLTGENNNKSKNNDELDPLDDDEHVVKRNKKLLSIGVNKILIKLSKNQSQVIKQLVANIYLNLASDRSNHGLMVQQGAIKALIPLATMTTTTMTTTAKTTMAPTKGTKENLQQYATQALAKIAITMNPNLVFRGERSTDLVKPLLNLCKSESELCQFESLMALTNLSSTDDNIRLHIYRLDGLGIVENLQLSDNIMVRRAATECLCNLMFCEPIFERYNDYEKSKNKIKVLVALSDVDDFETRRAASGCLAILSTDQNVCKMILERPRGLLTLKDLLDEQSVELQHRSVECLKNIASTNNKEMVEKLVESGVHKKLIELVKGNKEQVVTATCVETLKEISKHVNLQQQLLN
nr:13279_t:CDS:2 [Entrophospora candida]